MLLLLRPVPDDIQTSQLRIKKHAYGAGVLSMRKREKTQSWVDWVEASTKMSSSRRP